MTLCCLSRNFHSFLVCIFVNRREHYRIDRVTRSCLLTFCQKSLGYTTSSSQKFYGSTLFGFHLQERDQVVDQVQREDNYCFCCSKVRQELCLVIIMESDNHMISILILQKLSINQQQDYQLRICRGYMNIFFCHSRYQIMPIQTDNYLHSIQNDIYGRSPFELSVFKYN